MSATSGKPATSSVNTAAGRAEAAKAAVEANQAYGEAHNNQPTVNTGSGFGGGRITFDPQGNTRLNGKITEFAGQQNRDTYLAERGFGNNQTITDQGKASKADFSDLSNPSISGVIGDTEPKSIPQSNSSSRPKSIELDINEGIGFGDKISSTSKPSTSTKSISQATDFFTQDKNPDNNSILIANSNARKSNLKNENDFKSFIRKGQNQDAVFTFYANNKPVKESQGSRVFYDYLTTKQKFGDNISVGLTYPTKEKALSESVRKNTDYFSNLPSSYFEAAGKSGFVGKDNVNDINKSLVLNYEAKNRENLALLQGSLFSLSRGGEIPTKQGVKVVGPQENEVASFLKFPFAGNKTSTSFLKSTSLTDIATLYPGVPIADRLIDQAWWLGQTAKLQSKSGKIAGEAANKARTVIASKAIDSSLSFEQIKEKPISLAPRTIRDQATFRPTNPMREKLPNDIFIRDTSQAREPVSARPNTPRNNMFEDVTKETQTKLTNTQKDLLTPRQPDNNPPASRILSFFPGRKDVLGRPFTANVSPVKSPKNIGNESTNVSGLTSSNAPIKTTTDTSTTGLSPLSSQYFGVQFTGTYPTSYLPPVSGFATSKSAEVFPEFTNPLGRRGNPPIKRKLAKDEGKTEFYSDILSRRFNPEDTLTSSGKSGNINKSFIDITRTPKSKSESGIKSNVNPTDLSEFFIRPGKLDTDRILGTEKPSIGESKSRINDIDRAFNLRNERENPKEATAKTPISTPDSSKFVPSSKDFTKSNKEIGLDIKGAFTETNISLGKGLGFTYSKGGGTKLGFDINKPTNPSDAFGPKSNPKGTTKSSGSQLLVQVEKQSQENIVKSTGYREDSISLGSGKGSLITGTKSSLTTKADIANKKYLDSLTGSKYRSRFEEDYLYSNLTKPRQASKSESGLITDFRSSSLSRSKSGLISSSDSLLENLTKSRSAVKLKSNSRQSPKEKGIESLVFSSKPIVDVTTRPKQSTKPTQTTFLSPNQPNLPKQTQGFKFSFTPKQTTQLITTKEPPPKKVPLPAFVFGKPKNYKNKSKSGPTALLNLNVNNIFASTFNINVGKNRVEF